MRPIFRIRIGTVLRTAAACALLAFAPLSEGDAPSPPEPAGPTPSLRVLPPGFGTVSGRFRLLDEGVPFPEQALLVPVEPFPPRPGPPPPAASFDCPVGPRGRWRCALPAGTYDLVVAAAGFGPQRVQEAVVRAGSDLSVGILNLERGAAVTGRVAVESGPLHPETCLLRILPSPEERGRAKVYAGDPRLLERTLAADGRFSVNPVTEGLRALEVSCPGFATLHVDDVRVRPGRETRLRKPLLLRRPVEVEVAVTPPLDATDNPWTVHLDRISLGPFFLNQPVGRNHGPADLNGRFFVSRVAPSLARLEVFDSRGIRWHVRDLLLESPVPSPIRVDLRPIEVAGRVTFYGRGQEADVEFLDSVSGGRFHQKTGPRGEFRRLLPRAGFWRVALTMLRSSAPRIVRKVLVAPDPSGRARLTLEFPTFGLRGTVVDVYGNPASRAEVSLVGVDDERTALTDDKGRFGFGYLTPGPWAVAARRSAGYDWEAGVSPTQTVTIQWNGRSVPVELKLGDLLKVEGLVMAGGRPARGAPIQSQFDTNFPRRTATRRDGTFELEIPDDLDDETLLFRVRGGALKAVEFPLRPGRLGPLVADLPEASGTVTIELPRSWGALRDGGEQVDLFVDEHPLLLRDLEPWLQKRGYLLSPAARELTLPRLALGTYKVCLGPEGPRGRIDPAAYGKGEAQCHEGRLEAGEELRLKPVL